ncbi:hypothetical protein [Pseudogulbenkiania ferrooxidans]|nr:hypothetical protein [Pseudogulbenkiania ferrooxidans]
MNSKEHLGSGIENRAQQGNPVKLPPRRLSVAPMLDGRYCS